MLKMFELILETLIKTQTNQTVNINQLSMRGKFFFVVKKRKKSINHIVCVFVDLCVVEKRTQAGHGQSYEFLKSKYNKKFMAFDMIPEVHPNFMDSIKNHIFLYVFFCLYFQIKRIREKFTTTNIKC